MTPTSCHPPPSPGRTAEANRFSWLHKGIEPQGGGLRSQTSAPDEPRLPRAAVLPLWGAARGPGPSQGGGLPSAAGRGRRERRWGRSPRPQQGEPGSLCVGLPLPWAAVWPGTKDVCRLSVCQQRGQVSPGQRLPRPHTRKSPPYNLKKLHRSKVRGRPMASPVLMTGSKPARAMPAGVQPHADPVDALQAPLSGTALSPHHTSAPMGSFSSLPVPQGV